MDIAELNPGVMQLNNFMGTVPLHLDVDILNGFTILKSHIFATKGDDVKFGCFTSSNSGLLLFCLEIYKSRTMCIEIV